MKVDGTIDKFKARSVIQGFRHKEGIDYFDTYTSVARIATIRLLLALAPIHNLVIHQMDVKTIFLNGDMEEEVYMKQPKGFIMPCKKHKMCKPVKSLYGLKQAPKQWHQKFDEVVLSIGFLLNQYDKCVYSKFHSSDKGVIICLYADDILIFETDQNQVDKAKKFLSSKFSRRIWEKQTLFLAADVEAARGHIGSSKEDNAIGTYTYAQSKRDVLCNEGFDVLKISYLGELCVLIEFKSAKVKDLLKENGGANSWFLVLNQASEDFTLGGRIAWVEVEGIPFKLWPVYWIRAKEVPGWTPEFTKAEEEDDVSVEDNHGGIHSDQEINNCNDVSDVEEVPETCFNVPEGNLNEGHLDGGCAKKVNEEVAGDDNSFVHTVGGKENSGSVNKMSDPMGSCLLKKSRMPRIKLMIVVVYAPQEASEKRMLWDYLTHVSDQWDGEIVMMGDFNEVRYKSERFSSNFKAHDADIFKSFIHNAGLNEVHLGSSAFTWCHKSATKMIDGFDKLVRDAWNDAPGNKKNAIRNFMYKLKYTKEKIRGWLSTYRLNSRDALAKLKEDLRMFDEDIDKGNSPIEMVHKRLETLNKIQQVNNTHMLEVAQKAKIKWVVEGDENTMVKYEFLDHFRNRFDKPPENRARIDICFPNVLSNDLRDDLECMVTKEEVKKAVWDCVYWMRAKEVPGWTLEFTEEEEEDDVSVEDNHGGIHRNLNEGHLDGGCAKKVNEEVARDDNSFVHTVCGKENSRSVNKMSDSMGSCRLKKSGMPRTGGSILSFIEEIVKVGQTMGYNMDGCVKDITKIIKSQG
nr:zinc finger, CCHC-type [Tanacetum cinerariifolium]